MMALIVQMLGCLILAAGIGATVGWLLRHMSAAPIKQQLLDAETDLRIKDQALDTALYELKVTTTTLHALEGKVASLESLGRSVQQELASRQERIQQLHKELAASMQRSTASESDYQSYVQRIAEQDAALAAFTSEIRQATAAQKTAQEKLHQKEQELAEVQQRLGDLDVQREEIERLRAQVAELEPAQGRVHWIEVQLSEQAARNRTALHQLEQQIANRDQRLLEAAQQDAALQERDERIEELERRLASLQSLQTEIAGQAKMMGEKEEEISRLRKRLVEVRTALRIKTEGGTVLARPTGLSNQLSLQIGQSKPSNSPQKDDLKKIHGIGPVLERALNKMGTYTYIQIAKWTTRDIGRIAQKLGTFPDRIKRDNWMASARKQHRNKYGEKI